MPSVNCYFHTVLLYYVMEGDPLFQENNSLPASADRQNELFYRLSHPIRRQILDELVVANAGTELHIDELATEKAWSESDRVAVYHTHLPMLAAVGYIHWDRETDTVTRGSQFGTIAPVVALLLED